MVPAPEAYLNGILGICPFFNLLRFLPAAPLIGLTLIAVGLVAELIVAERPLDGLYEVAERVGWCAEQQAS